MNSPRFVYVVAGALATAVLSSSFAAAQMSPEKVAATNKILQQVKATVSKLRPSHQMMLDGYANVRHLADAWQAFGMRLADPAFAVRLNTAMNRAAATPAAGGGIVPVSNPSTDVAFSSMGGFTQSETSTARCGNNVVVGFNDSGSVFTTPFFFTGIGGESFSGSAYSRNGGASFTDAGPVNPGPENGNFLGGDPVINCGDANTFYFSQIFDFDDSSGNPWAAIALSKSTDGGQSWNDPVAAIAKDGDFHLLDKPWSTIDPSNHKHIVVSYTDFDSTETNSCGTNFPGRTAIEFVESFNGGTSWEKTPHVVIQVCGTAGVQGSQLAISSTGKLYISWVNLGSEFPLGPRAIQVASYANGKLSAPVMVDASVQPGGDSFFLQGEFRDFLDMAMAIDHSGTATDGTLYVTWADGRDKVVPDPLSEQGAYAYDDVLLRESSDGGKTWLGPIKVNSDIQSRLGSGHDHYQSGIAVDNRGFVAVCWYDRRADSQNFTVRRHCGESTNGITFSDVDIGLPGFAPSHDNDEFINTEYMGDYDQMTSDFLNENSGFIGSFSAQGTRGNPDAEAFSMH